MSRVPSFVLSTDSDARFHNPSRSSSVVPDFYSWIEVDGEPIKIYGTTESGNKAIGYIEAKEEFTIHSADLRRRPPRRAHNVSALVDGM